MASARLDSARLDSAPRLDAAALDAQQPGDGTPAPDTTVDAGARVDQSAPADQALPRDLPAPSPDTGSTLDAGTSNNPCAPGVGKGTVWGTTMVLCRGASTIDQCGAEALCNVTGGWTMCTASQYLDRGGRTKGSPDRGWIKTCVRSGGGKGSPPTDALCSTCASTSAKAAEVGWYCSNGTAQYDLPFAYIGAITSNLCWRVGENLASYGAYWSPLRTGNASLTSSAVCCR